MSKNRDVLNDRGYTILARWCRLSGSYQYYIQMQCDMAKEDNAPKNVIYCRMESEPGSHTPAEEQFTYRAPSSGRCWFTTDHITNEVRRKELGLQPLPVDHPVALDRARQIIEDLESKAKALRQKHNIKD